MSSGLSWRLHIYNKGLHNKLGALSLKDLGVNRQGGSKKDAVELTCAIGLPL